MLLPLLTPERARHLTASFARTHVLVIGDAMLDKFIVGRVSRISPEAPVPIVAFSHEMHRIGGAANVAHNIVALGSQATLVAATGLDAAAATLAAACREAGIAPSFVGDAGRQTTTKVRIVTERNQQVARVDYETDIELSADAEQRLIAEVQKHAGLASAIVISDYCKGVVTKRVVEAAVTAAEARQIPVLVDPKIPHLAYYAGTTLVTPNHHEAETATNLRLRSHDDARTAGRALRQQASCTAALITRGDQGMWLSCDDVEGHLPATAREVADVTGAGDTVIAAMALSLAVGATFAEGARLANEAAGISVGRFGPTTVSVAELLRAVDATASV